MTLNSLSFFVYLLLIFLAFYLMKDRHRWVVLVAASYVFYATFRAPQLLVALSLVTIISYGCGLRLGNLGIGTKRKATFWLGTSGCILILAIIKYLPGHLSKLNIFFFSDRMLIFVGVSYFVIQAISYLADINFGRIMPERHLGYFALYLSFFPKLLQGPIERANSLLPQLKSTYKFDYESIRYGMLLIAWGLFKKVVIADRLALFVNPIYGDVHSYSGVALLGATYFYAIQIYCDFSGYTDMALGTARIFNIKLTQNFLAPYLARSIADFWRRWHITLSTWLRDYLFLPLSYLFSRHIKAPRIFKIDSNVLIYCSSAMITFSLAGLWHGSAWTYLVWGLLHGFYLSFSSATRRLRKDIRRFFRRYRVLSKSLVILQTAFTFHLVVFTWIFFRSKDLSESFYILKAITKDFSQFFNFAYVRLQFRGLGLRESDLILVVCLVMIIFLVNLLELKAGNIWERLLYGPRWLRWVVYYLIASAILFYSPNSSANNFIYMRF